MMNSTNALDIARQLAVELDSNDKDLLNDVTIGWVSNTAREHDASSLLIDLLNDDTERPVIRTRAMSVLTAQILRAA